MQIATSEVRSPNTSRFPRAAGEPPRAIALRSLTVAFPPAGVSRYLDCSLQNLKFGASNLKNDNIAEVI